jgi:hypothetical protein
MWLYWWRLDRGNGASSLELGHQGLEVETRACRSLRRLGFVVPFHLNRVAEAEGGGLFQRHWSWGVCFTSC